jgi:hypothetical protein
MAPHRLVAYGRSIRTTCIRIVYRTFHQKEMFQVEETAECRVSPTYMTGVLPGWLAE